MRCLNAIFHNPATVRFGARNVTLRWRHNERDGFSNHLTIVYSIVYSGTDQGKHQSSASLAFVRGIHRAPVNSPHKGPVTRKMFPFDDVIMGWLKKSQAFQCNRLALYSNMPQNLSDFLSFAPTPTLQRIVAPASISQPPLPTSLRIHPPKTKRKGSYDGLAQYSRTLVISIPGRYVRAQPKREYRPSIVNTCHGNQMII